jgi:hypothetical protein
VRLYDRVVMMREQCAAPITQRDMMIGFFSGKPVIPIDGTEVMLWTLANLEASILNAGKVVPPFPLTWVEFDQSKCRLDTTVTDEPDGLIAAPAARSAFLLITNRTDDGWTVKGMPFMSHPDVANGRPIIPSIRTQRAILDANGMAVRMETALTLEGAALDVELSHCEADYRLTRMEEQNATNTGHAFVDALFVCLFANCKNIDLVDEPPRHTTKAVKRKMGGSPVRFKTIKLPGATSSGGTPGTATGPVESPLHLVRGHFKTYTPDKPLFGSRVGTYWWAHHVRGDEANGVSAHDYAVGPPT